MRSGMTSCAQGRRGYDNSARSRARLRRILRRLSVHREEDADQDRGPLRAWLCERHDRRRRHHEGVDEIQGRRHRARAAARGPRGRRRRRQRQAGPRRFHPPLRLPAGGNGDGGQYDARGRLARLFPLRPFPSTCPDHDHVEPRCPHRRLGLRHRAFPRQRSALDSATLIDAAHGGAAMALGAAEKAA